MSGSKVISVSISELLVLSFFRRSEKRPAREVSAVEGRHEARSRPMAATRGPGVAKLERSCFKTETIPRVDPLDEGIGDAGSRGSRTLLLARGT